MVIRRVCLDAFGTIFSPRKPVFEQYAEVARAYGLQVQDGEVKAGFKRAFKEWNRRHPLYGKHSKPPLDSQDWWKGVIGDTFSSAGVSSQTLDPVREHLSIQLVHRFWGSEAYELHSDFIPFLNSLESLDISPPSIVSNTDPVLSTILDNLGVSTSKFGPKGIRNEEIYTTWEIEKEKQDIGFWDDVLRRLNENEKSGQEISASEVLVVGDELVADHETPRQAGFRSLLLRREATDHEHANPSYVDEINGRKDGIDAVRNLSEAIEWIRRTNEQSL